MRRRAVYNETAIRLCLSVIFQIMRRIDRIFAYDAVNDGTVCNFAVCCNGMRRVAFCRDRRIGHACLRVARYHIGADRFADCRCATARYRADIVGDDLVVFQDDTDTAFCHDIGTVILSIL